MNRVMRAVVTIGLALCAWLCLAPSALAVETIEDFDVEITVETDGDIVVRETIAVTSEGRRIRRGIFRELPKYYTFAGVRQRYRYDLISITRDGRPEPYSKASAGSGAVTWRIGSADVLLEDGLHTYEIVYRVAEQVRHHDDKQEVYWNVTGNYWEFPIQQANARIVFPDGAQVIETAAYTGRLGENQPQDARIDVDGPVVDFATTRTLSGRQGLTVAAAVEPGVLAPMSRGQRIRQALIRYGAYPLVALGLGALLAFYYRRWDKVGRDPTRLPVFPRYAPPEGYGPAAVHIIHHKRPKGTDWFTAEITQLATQGHVEITAEKDLIKIKRLTDGPPEGTEGRTILDKVIAHKVGRTLKLGKGITNARFSRALDARRSKLTRLYTTPYFKGNGGWALLGVLISMGVLLLFGILPVAKSGSLALVVILAVTAINLTFLFLLRARSELGERINSEIDGFKLYLETAEADRINTANPLGERPPAMSLELYERFLPYAIALGVEKPWTKHFERVLPEVAADYTPRHISGNAIRAGRPIDIGRSVAKGLTAGVAAAAPVSVSSGSGGGFSSGSSGGGSSGGGGGGGGGGGW